jgi:predicted DsbA family dithiol-disulfide isomerase
LVKDYGVEVEWKAFLLRPDMPPEGMARDPNNPRAIESRRRLTEMATEAGLEMRFKDHTSNSRLALEAAEFARAEDQHEVFHRALFTAYWIDRADIGDREVLLDLARKVRLDTAGLARALDEGTYSRVVDEEMSSAHKLGINAVPSFVFDDQYLVQGAQPYEAFQHVLERFVLSEEGHVEEKP